MIEGTSVLRPWDGRVGVTIDSTTVEASQSSILPGAGLALRDPYALPWLPSVVAGEIGGLSISFCMALNSITGYELESPPGQHDGTTLEPYVLPKTTKGRYNQNKNMNGTKNAPAQENYMSCLLYTSPSPRDKRQSRMPSSA